MDRSTVKEAVREATDIVALVSRYTSLQPAGKRMKGLSPFKREKTPSFFVDPAEGLYYCFSTQKGGDVFTFVQEMEGMTFAEALAELADRAGIDMRDTDRRRGEIHAPVPHPGIGGGTVPRETHRHPPRIHPLPRTDRTVAGTVGDRVRSRRMGHAMFTADAGCGQSHTVRHVHQKSDTSVYDRFRNRIMFPFHDIRGRIIGFSGRDRGDAGGAKYINSPESPIFHKSTYLYGLHLAKKHIRKSNFSILTEGPIDTIMVHQAGYPVAVAVSGTGVTENHVRQLQQLSNRLLIAFDGDQAGIRASRRVIGMALEIGMDVKVLELENGADPASVIRKDSDSFRNAVKDATPAIQFILRHTRKKYGDTDDGMYRGVKEEITPVIASAKEPLARDYMVRETAAFSGLGADAIAEEVNRIRSRRNETGNGERRTPDRTPPSLPQPGKQLTDRIDDLYGIASRARQFLFLRTVPLSEDARRRIAGITTEYGPLNEYDEKLATLYYEELAGDDPTRTDMAQRELADSLSRLENEVKKYNVLKKSKMEKE